MRSESTQPFAVLFVDDEEKAQKYFRMAYANHFPVLTASNVPEALDVLAEHGERIAILVTDQRMPGQQGVDLLKRAREDWPGIVRILTTAYSDLDNAIAAVNRGEILRYVTKPWDIQALRADLRHAMDFFLLRRERDLLMAEKLSVLRNMAHSDRLRGLLTIAGGLMRLRHAPHAVAAWLRDSLSDESAAQPATGDLELWGLEVKETFDLMAVHRSLRDLDNSVEPGFPDRADLTEPLHGVGLALECGGGEIAMRRNLIEPLFGSLARLAGQPASARLEQDPDTNGNMELTISVEGRESGISPFAGGPAVEGDPAVGLLGSYLIAWHHGGGLRTTTAEEQVRFVLTLPRDPDAVVLPEPDEGWLAGQFAMLEDWQ